MSPSKFEYTHRYRGGSLARPFPTPVAPKHRLPEHPCIQYPHLTASMVAMADAVRAGTYERADKNDASVVAGTAQSTVISPSCRPAIPTTDAAIGEERDDALNALRRLLQSASALPDSVISEIQGALAEARATVQRLEMANAVREADAGYLESDEAGFAEEDDAS